MAEKDVKLQYGMGLSKTDYALRQRIISKSEQKIAKMSEQLMFLEAQLHSQAVDVEFEQKNTALKQLIQEIDELESRRLQVETREVALREEERLQSLRIENVNAQIHQFILNNSAKRRVNKIDQHMGNELSFKEYNAKLDELYSCRDNQCQIRLRIFQDINAAEAENNMIHDNIGRLFRNKQNFFEGTDFKSKVFSKIVQLRRDISSEKSRIICQQNLSSHMAKSLKLMSSGADVNNDEVEDESEDESEDEQSEEFDFENADEPLIEYGDSDDDTGFIPPRMNAAFRRRLRELQELEQQRIRERQEMNRENFIREWRLIERMERERHQLNGWDYSMELRRKIRNLLRKYFL